MSEEDDFNFDDNENDEQEAGEFDQEEAEQEGVDSNGTPEEKYKKAKELIGFEDYEAIDMFYDIYCDPSASLTIKGKSLKRAAVTLSQTDDYERIIGALTDVFNAYVDGIISSDFCSKIVRKMMPNVRNEDALSNFLCTAAENIDKNDQLQLFIDVKLRQAELSLKKSEFEEARQELSDVEQYVGTSHENIDKQMLNSLIRVLFLKIEIEEVFSKDENAIFDYYKSLMDIDPNMPFGLDRQKAVLKKIEGQKALYKGDFAQAAELFHEAFKLFDSAGSDKKIDCLPFLALAVMCTKDLNDISFSDPQITPYLNYPIVVPLKQLLDTFNTSKYAKFAYLLDSAKKVFIQKIQKADYYCKLLDDISVFVLRNNIKIFCPSYKTVELAFLSKELKCKMEEARDLVIDLINNNEIHANVDIENNLLLLQKPVKESPHLKNVQEMLNALKDTVKKQSKMRKIIIE